jgi:hypothetical protein
MTWTTWTRYSLYWMSSMLRQPSRRNRWTLPNCRSSWSSLRPAARLVAFPEAAVDRRVHRHMGRTAMTARKAEVDTEETAGMVRRAGTAGMAETGAAPHLFVIVSRALPRSATIYHLSNCQTTAYSDPRCSEA